MHAGASQLSQLDRQLLYPIISYSCQTTGTHHQPIAQQAFPRSRIPTPTGTHDPRNRTPKSRYDLQNLRISELRFFKERRAVLTSVTQWHVSFRRLSADCRKKLAVQRLPWEAAPLEIDSARPCRSFVGALGEFNESNLDTSPKGYSMMEMMWDPPGPRSKYLTKVALTLP